VLARAAEKKKTSVGGYDLGQAQKQMDALKQVPVGAALILLHRGMSAIDTAMSNAKQPWYKFNLPGDTARKNVAGHLQWHADALAKVIGNSNAIYDSGADLKKWVLNAFVEQNASEEGSAAAGQQWSKAWSDWADMWIEVGKFIATLPKEIAKGVGDLAGDVVKGVTGLPLWAWALIGLGVVGVIGFVAWSIINSKAGAAIAGTAARRYLP
jgi:hypothetical protein